MDLLLHTIALEPARWTSRKVDKPFAKWMHHLAEAGFSRLEVFEPHLTLATDENALVTQMAGHGLAPVVLSSYLDLSPATNPDVRFRVQAKDLLERVERFGFRKVRLFPGQNPSSDAKEATISRVCDRMRLLADSSPKTEFLLETHDGSLADDPICIVHLVEICARPNIGLLWQPTVFEPNAAEYQFEVQKSFIRHFHLQSRTPDGRFTTLSNGVIPWSALLEEPGPVCDLTLEFVPSGICASERFDFETSLREAVSECAYVKEITTRTAVHPAS